MTAEQDPSVEAQARLRSKVKPGSPPKTVVLEEMEKAIQGTVDEMGDQAVREDFAALTNAYHVFRAKPGPETVEALEHITHKMRGYAAAVGYSALGDVADSLARYTIQRPRNQRVHEELVALHFLAAKLILDAGPSQDDGGGKVRAVVDALQSAVAHFLDR